MVPLQGLTSLCRADHALPEAESKTLSSTALSPPKECKYASQHQLCNTEVESQLPSDCRTEASHFTRTIPTVPVQWTSPITLPRDNASAWLLPAWGTMAKLYPQRLFLLFTPSLRLTLPALKQHSAPFFSLPLKLTRWGCFLLQLVAWNHTSYLTDYISNPVKSNIKESQLLREGLHQQTE